MAKPEDEKQVAAAAPVQPQPTSQMSGLIQGIANGGRIGLPSKADAVARMMPAPVANAIDIGTMIARGLRGPKTPAISSAAAAPAPAAATQPTVQQPASSTLGLTPVSLDKMWNTKLNQAPQASAVQPAAARSRPSIVRAATPKVAQGVAAAAAPQAPVDDNSVIIDRGVGGPPGSVMAMVDNETGQVLTARGDTDTYRPFEGQYMTQGQQDEITANRLKIGDPMTAGQAGAISKQSAVLADRALAEAAANSRTDKTVAGGIAQQKISTGGLIQSANIAHGKDNERKDLENKAILALDAATKSGDGAAIAAAQQQLAAIRSGVTGSEYAPINMYDDMGNVIGQRLYNKKTGSVQGQSGAAAAQTFENGKVYTDANGNRAKYVDGKWQGVK